MLVKAAGKITAHEALTELKKSMITKRGEGISRHLFNFMESRFFFKKGVAIQFLQLLHLIGTLLNTRRVALLFDEIPVTFGLESLAPFLNSDDVEIGIFVEQTKAIEFLNQIDEGN